MREAMRSRGLEGAGLWISQDKRVALAHRRLSIIDLSEAGAQPMATPDQSVRVVFNGEIYNFPELRRDLLAKGHTFYTSTDTEVIVHLYEEYGADFPVHLHGMFAIALWDEKQRRLVLDSVRLPRQLRS